MIGPTTIAALFADPGWNDLLAEYEAESAVEGTPSTSARLATYAMLEERGILFPFAAHIDRALVGFIGVLAAPLPHYDRIFAVSESFFVAKAHRMSGAGVKLLKAAEAKAREVGSPGLFVSAPCRGSLFGVLPRMGYNESSRIFFKAFHDA